MSVHSSGLLGFLTSLMEKNYEAVGFIPRPKLEEYAARGQVLIETENETPCGYLVFGNGWPRLRIYQACIQYDARRREHGIALVERVIREADVRGCDSISLWCADDLDANNFWKAAGFAFGGQREGGMKRGRKHNLWVMRLPTAQMELSMPNVNWCSCGGLILYSGTCAKCGERWTTNRVPLTHAGTAQPHELGSTYQTETR